MDRACLLGILAYNSQRDIRTGKIPLVSNLLFCIWGLGWEMFEGGAKLSGLCGGIALGGAVLLLGILTGEAIGMGTVSC